jgi:hypothetical protein
MYVKPTLEVFGSVRDLTQTGIDMVTGDPTGLGVAVRAKTRSGALPELR